MPAKKIDWTYAFLPTMPDLEAIKPRVIPVERAYWLQPQDGTKPNKIWAYHDKMGWHGWNMTGETVHRNQPFTTWPNGCWKEVDKP